MSAASMLLKQPELIDTGIGFVGDRYQAPDLPDKAVQVFVAPDTTAQARTAIATFHCDAPPHYELEIGESLSLFIMSVYSVTDFSDRL